jgi:hypothetical protein
VATDEFSHLLTGFRSSAFRLEALQHYATAYDERFEAFQAGRPLPPPSPAKQASMRLVAEATAAGKRFYRVHVVELPLTPYLRYELAAYSENLAAGEEIYIAERAANPGLAELTQDFYLFDDQIVVWFRYDDHGHLLGRERGDNPADLARCREQRDRALAHAVPLDQFLATNRQ